MTVDEIIQIAKANIGKSVTMKFDSGAILTAEVRSVDDEGFVYDPDPPETRTTNPLYWSAYSDIQEIRKNSM